MYAGAESGGGFDTIKQVKFLAAFSTVGTIGKAAELAECHRSSHSNWMRRDPTYPARFRDAKREAADSLESEAIRRARDGFDEPIFSKGVQVGTVRRYSDKLLETLLRAFKPKRYKTVKEVEHRHADAPKFESKEAKVARVTAALARVRGEQVKAADN